MSNRREKRKKIDKYEEIENEISMRISKYVVKKQKGMSKA